MGTCLLAPIAGHHRLNPLPSKQYLRGLYAIFRTMYHFLYLIQIFKYFPKIFIFLHFNSFEKNMENGTFAPKCALLLKHGKFY